MPIYQILIRLLSPFIWLIVIIEGLKTQAGWAFISQKLGLHYSKPTQNFQHPYWIHCASVGEVKAAEPLIRYLMSEHKILLTTNTKTSQQLVKELFEQQVCHRYLPFDWPFALKRFIKTYKPSRLLIVETEIWPNLFRVANKNGIEICILNGRLTQKTFQSPNWLQTAYRNSLRRVDTIIARSEIDAQLFSKLGADPKKIQVLGNLKYSAQPEIQKQTRPIERDFILAASTHDDEELNITQLWLELNRPELLVIVPRHPKRSIKIQKQLQFLGSTLKVATKNESIEDDTKVYLDDRIGRLLPLYAYAKIVIMGGSYVAKGGHNILEPAAFKKAILTGNDSSDFQDEMNLLKAENGIIQNDNYRQLQHDLITLLDHPDQAQQLGENAYQALQKQKNTLQNYLTALNIQ
ncbi:3-deoxy-D-manno-octulosonic acid transferase [Thiomicrorhabdus sp. Milos-T2]|uniref:3-deoxy-D-manno-octulosonic acid transferase n=1 Tax=Thiomicrorhabdus sp. Milos-T2 TaxID=90814 RepID=UPI0004942E62|nr:glycosyltransferase N-terminal domain-containing protein [Thiomicrorhabdus sp. Milos-T2]